MEPPHGIMLLRSCDMCFLAFGIKLVTYNRGMSCSCSWRALLTLMGFPFSRPRVFENKAHGNRTQKNSRETR